jgi:hypothetical protein
MGKRAFVQLCPRIRKGRKKEMKARRIIRYHQRSSKKVHKGERYGKIEY